MNVIVPNRYDTVSANMMTRVGVTKAIMELLTTTLSDDMDGAIWCLSRICRSKEIVDMLFQPAIIDLVSQKGLLGSMRRTSRLSACFLGGLILTDEQADELSDRGLVEISVINLIRKASLPNALPEDICAATFLVARLARSIKISKALAKAGCVGPLVHALLSSVEPDVLHWSARAVGCLMRPNSLEMANVLLGAGCAAGLARLPRVLPEDQVEPLASFAFAIQRFVCAEWGGGTRKALVDAGVIDSLLSALRTAANVPAPHVHVELAHAVVFLCDIGGGDVRKEIVRAGGVNILKHVAETASPEVAEVCNAAVTSLTGNIFSRNLTVTKTALRHDWSGGCPVYLLPRTTFGCSL
ncbi:uncharacterized protein EI90DRAFT_1900224 [Cantharellus anzutake]|uniref:uncharacterized protein n=1 Tax=Cantharellus anzutake TaxID=1750568 RepID=UPI0019079C9C|nr:uncharacterized protein EI90DRAFT_1900224 [Cantharellus anzutake]KAF8326530.1 hypothetical protein EI90DRAFT_1900224 [Cantharellus anzutake]